MILANVLISTARSPVNVSTGLTQAAVAHLSGVAVHIGESTKDLEYHALQAGAVTTEFLITANAGTDIRAGDYITSIVLITDGVTPWPGLGLASSPIETYLVILEKESDPGPLANREVIITRFTGGGPTY